MVCSATSCALAGLLSRQPASKHPPAFYASLTSGKEGKGSIAVQAYKGSLGSNFVVIRIRLPRYLIEVLSSIGVILCGLLSSGTAVGLKGEMCRSFVREHGDKKRVITPVWLHPIRKGFFQRASKFISVLDGKCMKLQSNLGGLCQDQALLSILRKGIKTS
eukprot:scaffold177994_cov15-Tisochrysis_lutea.AAC.1